METPKFKVGDRVRTTGENKWLYDIGEAGTVIEADPDRESVTVHLDVADTRRGEYKDRIFIMRSRLELIEAPIPKHTTYTPDGVTISMELEWEIARLLGICQALGGSDIKGQAEKINQMWMGK